MEKVVCSAQVVLWFATTIAVSQLVSGERGARVAAIISPLVAASFSAVTASDISVTSGVSLQSLHTLQFEKDVISLYSANLVKSPCLWEGV